MVINSVLRLAITDVEVCVMDEIRIHFGAMLNIYNQRINQEVCRGEYLLHIVDAAWRIKQQNKILFSSEGCDDEAVDIFRSFLINRKIIAYLDTNKFDCLFSLDNGDLLETFFYHTDIDEPVKWLLDFPDGSTYYHLFT